MMEKAYRKAIMKGASRIARDRLVSTGQTKDSIGSKESLYD
jgi:hypothetical protein